MPSKQKAYKKIMAWLGATAPRASWCVTTIMLYDGKLT
jgi:hypothetical protein